MAGVWGLKTFFMVIVMLLVCVSKGSGEEGRGVTGGGKGGGHEGNREGRRGGGGGGGGGRGEEGQGRPRFQFYRNRCNGQDVEYIVLKTVKGFMDRDSTLAASLLRLQFHDCFLRSCDASVLLKSTSTNRGVQEAIANKFFRGLDIIDEAKAALEMSCPGVVSCADILALATRDVVSMLEGSVSWIVRTGRRDGVVSNESEVPTNIPSPFDHFSQLTDLFARKGFGVPELVVLSGAHTIGKAHCGAFSPRLYNNSGIGDTDPSLDPAYANHLKTICSPSDRTTAVPMDPDTPLIFDDNYYKLLQKNKGLLKSDATLLTGWQARNIINNQIGGDFTVHFSQAMGKLVELEVLTGTDGEIRKLYGSVNSK